MLERLFISPADREEWLRLRIRDITSTEISAVFGISPYLSRYELWHCKRDGTQPHFEDNERVQIGKHLEAGIAAAACEINGWNAAPMDDYGRIPSLRIGSSFDWHITLESGERALLEIKNVDYLVYKSDWINPETGEEEAPPHIELQVQHQMLVSGIRWAAIVALVGGNRLVTLIREADDAVHEAIIRECNEFWRTVDANERPEPEYGKDYSAIARIHTEVKDGKYADPNPRIDELAKQWYDANQEESAAKLKKETACAEIIDLMGDSEIYVGPTSKITCGLTKKGNRTCRVYYKGDDE